MPRKTADSPLTDLQAAFVTTFVANGCNLVEACKSAGCEVVTARHWLNTHPAVRARLGMSAVGKLSREEVLVRLSRIARKPAKVKINWASQIAALELLCRVEGYIHEPAPSTTQVVVAAGASTADASRYAELANAAALASGDAMPALPAGDPPAAAAAAPRPPDHPQGG
jgi:hypothetical protein